MYPGLQTLMSECLGWVREREIFPHFIVGDKNFVF